MSITHCLYRTERIPSLRPGGGWRAAIGRYLPTEICYDERGNLLPEEQRSSFAHWVLFPDFDAYYCHLWCEPSVHALCEADPDITPLTDEYPSREALQAALGGTLGGDFNRLITLVEADGIPLDDVNAASTFGQLMRQVARHHHLGEAMYGDGFKKAPLILAKSVALNHRRNQIPPLRGRLARLLGRVPTGNEERVAEVDWIAATAGADLWMAAHGVSVGSIPGNATMRELRRRARSEAVLDPQRFPMRLHKLEL